MGDQFSVNQTPATGAAAMYQLKNLLVGSAGWTIVMSGRTGSGPSAVWAGSAQATITVNPADVGCQIILYGYSGGAWITETVTTTGATTDSVASFTYLRGAVPTGAAPANAWSVAQKAGATVYSISAGATGRPIDIITSGANLAVDYAWFVLESPDGNRQFVVQRGSGNNLYWLIAYSTKDSGGFISNFTSVTQTVRPTAADEHRTLESANTPTQFYDSDNSYRYHCYAMDAAPYCFWSVAVPNGGGNPKSFFFFDAMVSGTYPVADVDPYVMWSIYDWTVSNTNNALLATTNGPLGHLAKGLVGESFTNIGGLGYHNGTTGSVVVPAKEATYSLGTNPHDSYDDELPLIYARPAAAGGTTGYKGMSTLIRLSGTLRANCDTYSVSSARDRIYLFRASYGNVILKWDGSIPTV